jgi:hypothetical protein
MHANSNEKLWNRVSYVTDDTFLTKQLLRIYNSDGQIHPFIPYLDLKQELMHVNHASRYMWYTVYVRLPHLKKASAKRVG